MKMKEIKKAIIDLYLTIKIRKISDINKLNNNLLEKEEEELYKLPILDIINF